MKLSDLEAQFVRRTDGGFQRVDSIAEAEGLFFICPGCFKKLGTKVGAHSLLVWTHVVPAGINPGPGRWSFKGTGIHDLTVDVAPGQKYRSIDAGCWHGCIDNGDAHE